LKHFEGLNASFHNKTENIEKQVKSENGEDKEGD
jgi:hypothetical protein